MGFQRSAVSRWCRRNIEGQCTGVIFCSIEHVAQVHKEDITLPAETILDVRIGVLCSMEEIS